MSVINKMLKAELWKKPVSSLTQEKDMETDTLKSWNVILCLLMGNYRFQLEDVNALVWGEFFFFRVDQAWNTE